MFTSCTKLERTQRDELYLLNYDSCDVAFTVCTIKTCALFILFSRNDQFCFIMTFGKKSNIFKG